MLDDQFILSQIDSLQRALVVMADSQDKLIDEIVELKKKVEMLQLYAENGWSP